MFERLASSENATLVNVYTKFLNVCTEYSSL